MRMPSELDEAVSKGKKIWDGKFDDDFYSRLYRKSIHGDIFVGIDVRKHERQIITKLIEEIPDRPHLGSEGLKQHVRAKWLGNNN